MIKKPMMMLEPEDPNGGGGGGESDGSNYDPWAPKGDEGDAGGGGGGDAPDPNPAPAAPAHVSIDPKAFEAFGKSFGETFAKTQQQTQQQAPPTPEQIAEARKALHFFDIDDNFIKEFGDLGTQKRAMEKFRDGLTKHILTVFNHLRANDRTEYEKTLSEKFTPLESMLSERANSERQTRFNSRYPQFSAPELAPSVEAVIGHLAGRKAFEGKSEAESFKLVAEALAAQAKTFNPHFVLEDAEANGASHSSNRRGNSIPAVSGGSGASRSSNNAPAKKGWALAHIK